MNIQNVTEVLGAELVEAFTECCDGNESEVDELIDEAIRALKVVRANEDWSDNEIIINQ